MESHSISKKMNLPISKVINEFRTYATETQIVAGGGKAYWIADMAWCLLKYGARPIDYVRFGFYLKNRFARDKYLTFIRYRKLVKKLFKGGARDIFANKVEEYKLFRKYINRPWLYVTKETSRSEILDFVNKNTPVIAKPNHGEQGHGIIVLQKDNSIDELVQVLELEDYLLEKMQKNCPELEQLNPSSLNTLRVVTLLDTFGEPHILGAWLRVGASGKVIDNWGGGGVGYNVDIETGLIDRLGKDKRNRKYIYHPSSGILMLGFKIPHFLEIKKRVLEMALIMPQARYVGWDIAVTPEGIDLIEMNCPPGHDMMQAFETPIYPIIKKLW